MRNAFSTLAVIAVLIAGCGGDDEAANSLPETRVATTPVQTQPQTVDTTPAGKPKSRPAPARPEMTLRQARAFAKGTSYEVFVKQITRVEANELGNGVNVQTKLYSDDEGKDFARKVAAPFVANGIETRVYAANDDLLFQVDP